MMALFTYYQNGGENTGFFCFNDESRILFQKPDGHEMTITSN